MPFFIFSSGKENTATAETSEPLPAVVGIIIVGRPRAGTFSEPTIAAASSSGNFASTADVLLIQRFIDYMKSQNSNTQSPRNTVSVGRKPMPAT